MAVATEQKIPSDTRLPPKSGFRQIPMAAFALGIVCLGAWVVGYRADYDRAIFGYVFAYASVLSMALGCLIFVIIQHLTRAGWSVAVRRVPEAVASTLPLFAVLFIPIAMSTHALFPWTHALGDDKVLLAKAPYLNETFFMIRAACYLLVWSVMGIWFYKMSVRQDAGNLQEETRKMWKLSAPAVLVFALSISFAAFDWFMSLQPHWYSTIFGVYFFAGSFLSALALIALIYMVLQAFGVLRNVVTAEHYHDLGKLTFAFTVFWAYVSFSQFMLYWYANIPEETEFYMVRLHNGWDTLSWALPLTNFFIPFFALLSCHVKRNKIGLGICCIYVILAHFLDLYWLVLPNCGAHSEAGGPDLAGFHVSGADVLALVGILSLFIGCVSFVLSRKQLVPVGDPRLAESLAFENA